MVSAFFAVGVGVGTPGLGLGVLGGVFTGDIFTSGVTPEGGVPGACTGVPVGPGVGAIAVEIFGAATLISGKLRSTSGEISFNLKTAPVLFCLSDVHLLRL